MSKRQITRERILNAAWTLFAENGYEETTTRQIAREAGVADGTVFSHFPTKLDMLREGMLSQLTQLSEQTLKSSDKAGVELGKHLVSAYYHFYFRNVSLSRALLKEVIWDLEYYQTFNQQLFEFVSLDTTLESKLPLIMDCYFMTLIGHLSKPQPCVEDALAELEHKFQLILKP
ncbi:TetR/AcrR family transcriptional regulator [Vibrio japonicus]|uniref:TetR/AcrR family transcriptional regulator n=1 Tax=Vibrio japonicus TaxID=1824638 RepID=A0ABY5LGR6_9VIBR|nr:TetR/AcrR family transcriptional regulator [Vibrio japonicus]UUM30064.1 TetR/AcrR family transcriptional regulator [Vibrio japonicus]